jgi:hypothetical protein
VVARGLSKENAAEFVDRGPDLRKYLGVYCDRGPLAGGAYRAEISVEQGELFVVLAEVRTDPPPWAWADRKDLFAPFDAVRLKRQGVLAKVLYDWTYEVARSRAATDPLRRAAASATFAVLYDRTDLGASVIFPFAPSQGRMYPQTPMIYRSKTVNRLFFPTTLASGAALSRDLVFALDPPNIPDLAGKLPGTDVIYAFFDEPQPAGRGGE